MAERQFLNWARFLFPLAAGMWLLVAAGCGSQVVVFQDVRSDLMRNRTIVFIDSSPSPPLTESRQRAILERLEQALAGLPRIGKIVTRRETFTLTEGNFTIRNEYQLYADTLSTVGVSDRELAADLGKALHADLLFNAQVFYTPCTYCPDGGSAYLVAQVIDAATNKLLMRVDVRSHPQPNDQALGDSFGLMEEEFLDELNVLLTPKSHLERFRNLERRRDS